MTYATTNPPTLVSQRIASGPALWIYTSADDDATVNGSDYFTDGLELGMQLGDFVLVFDTATPKGSLHYVSVLDADGNATTAFAAVA